MNTLSFDDIDRIYRNCANFSLKYINVESSELARFVQDLSEFERDLKDLQGEDYWQTYLRKLKRSRFELCAAPLSKLQKQQMMEETLNWLRSHLKNCAELYPSVANNAHALVNRLATIINSEENPLLNAIRNGVDSNRTKPTALVVKASRLLQPTSSLIKAYPFMSEVEVLLPSELHRKPYYERLLVVGPTRWYPSELFSSPKAEEIIVLKYDWIVDNWSLQESFISPVVNRTHKAKPSLPKPLSDKAWIDAAALLPTANLVELTARMNREERYAPYNYDDVEARAILLPSEQVVFLEADGTTLVIDLDDQEDQVKRVAVNDLNLGMYLLLRTAGGGDYIVSLADHFLGNNAIRFRTCQRNWKDLLSHNVENGGMDRVISTLTRLGATHANEANLRNWMSRRTITAESSDDFKAIMRLIGLENEFSKYWETMLSIRTAHRQAGSEIRRRLLEVVKSADLEVLMQQGVMEFTLADVETGSLTAFQIEEIGTTTVTLPYSQVGYPFQMENE